MNNIDTKRVLNRFGNNEYLVNIKKYKEENNISDNPLNSNSDINNNQPHSYINKHIKIQQNQMSLNPFFKLSLECKKEFTF